MSQNPLFEDTKRKLDELAQRIDAAKSSMGAANSFAGDAQQEWDQMVRAHADISRKLAGDQSAQAAESARLDVDALRHSFDRWIARVETSFSKKP